MSTPLLATKLYIPPPRHKAVARPRLITRLNEGLRRKLTLISAPAGFGKTTLVSAWIADSARPVAWLSLDEGDNDPHRFLMYLVAALQTIAPDLGKGVLGVLQSPQHPPVEAILTALLNEITIIPHDFVLVLDDYHVIETKLIDDALAFLLDHLPPQMHLVIATREDPNLPLARLRVRGQLTELRVVDLRFTAAEAADFLNQGMGLTLSETDIASLETRTEGWVAGLQLAAISLQGHQDAAHFIKSFTGSHHFVLDYLVEEVLHRQSESVQTFLLHTSILDRLCGPLCDAVLDDTDISGREMLESLDRANLFIIPLDNERRWYRYHHLFVELLRQRLPQSLSEQGINDLHRRASAWYEANGLDIEAFRHAAAANDFDNAARLVEGKGMPLPFRGAAGLVMNWLDSLPPAVLDARPSLWVLYASVLLFVSQLPGIEEKLQAAERALERIDQDEQARDWIGHIASIRATVAVTQHDADVIMAQSLRALEHLHPHNLPVRTATIWTMGHAHFLQGDRVAAQHAYAEAVAISRSIGHFIINIMATMGLGTVQFFDNQLPLAAQTYQHVLSLLTDPPIPAACEVYSGLTRIFYEWNDLVMAEQYAQQSLVLARQLETTDRYINSEMLMARLKLAQGDLSGAALILAQAEQHARQKNFGHQLPEIAAIQVLLLLRQGNVTAAAQLAWTYDLPITQASVHLAQGHAAEALALLMPVRQTMEARGWHHERLTMMVFEAVVRYRLGDKTAAISLVSEALALAEPGGFIRLFVDHGPPMAHLLSEVAARGIMPIYTSKLLAAFDAEQREDTPQRIVTPQLLIEPLSQREVEVLQLIAQGLSNNDISERLFLALSTVKGHNQRIFDKLQVERRTEAVARARELGLL